MDIRDHGGYCCGVRHIYSMDNGTEEELQRLIRRLDNEQNQGNRLIEIILSSRQVGDSNTMQDRNPPDGWPAILQRNGFRLVSRFRNSNSGNDCYIFHRVPEFKSIRSADLPFAWEHGGQIVPQNLQAGGPGRLTEAGHNFPVGARVRYIRAGHGRYGQTGVVVGTGRVLRIRWGNTGEEIGGYNPDNLELVNAPVEPAQAATVVATFYANWLTTYRVRGAYHPTLEACRNAAPRCRRRDRLDIYSDGRQVWTENVQGG